MTTQTQGLISTLMELPIFHAEWVLWLLIVLSVMSVSIILDRVAFFVRRRINVEDIRTQLVAHLSKGRFDDAVKMLEKYDSLETNVLRFGLQSHAMGPDAVSDLLAGAERREKARFENRLGLLATIAANAPFVGLFGTVLGIIKSFKDLSGNMNEASNAVMAGIAEALIATAIGLLVAIPAVVAYNSFKTRIKKRSDNLSYLASIVSATLKSPAPTEENRKER